MSFLVWQKGIGRKVIIAGGGIKLYRMGSEILKPVKYDCKIRLTFQGAGSDIVVLWFFGRGSYFLMLFSGVMGIRKRDKTRKNTINKKVQHKELAFKSCIYP